MALRTDASTVWLQRRCHINFIVRSRWSLHFALAGVWVNLMTLFAPGTDCHLRQPISQTAQYRQSDWWYPKQWLMKWFSKDDKSRKWTIVKRSKSLQTLECNTYWTGRNQSLRGRGRLHDVIVMHVLWLRYWWIERIRSIHLVDQMYRQISHVPSSVNVPMPDCAAKMICTSPYKVVVIDDVCWGHEWVLMRSYTT